MLKREYHRKNVDSCYPPIFIIGAPRTGSTLLYQLIIKVFNTCYISNVMALFPMFMSTIAIITKKLHSKSYNIERSEYGIVNGLYGPNEAGKINNLWFNNVENEKNNQKVRNTIGKLSKSYKSPIIIKSLANSLRIKNVKKVLPNAKFIFIKRNNLYTAQSILLARNRLLGSIDKWFSLKPQGYKEIIEKENPYFQVLWQINSIQKKIREDLKKTGSEYIEIEYEDLCLKTSYVLSEIARFMNVEIKNDDENFDEIKYQKKIKISKDEWIQLKKIQDMIEKRK